jgi:hypothetical protein
MKRRVGAKGRRVRETTKIGLITEALEAQQRALDELVALTESQATMIAGMVLAFRGFVDLLLDEKQRNALRTHVDLMASRELHDAAHTVTRMFMD